MTKFHISENGEPAVCTAKIKCRLGGDSGTENHFDTAEETREAYEKKMQSETIVSSSKSFDGTFGSTEERKEKSWPAVVKYYDDFVTHYYNAPPGGPSFTEADRQTYGTPEVKHTPKIAEAFGTTPENVIVGEHALIVKKDNKFLAMTSIGLYAEGDIPVSGDEMSREEVKALFGQDGDYEFGSGTPEDKKLSELLKED